uniref:Serine/arginine repetitive matrix protein 2 n=1 Tax=Macrostomum lignano TaxID=282301 RepID=A0A1I8F802_9PLAT
SNAIVFCFKKSLSGQLRPQPASSSQSTTRSCRVLARLGSRLSSSARPAALTHSKSRPGLQDARPDGAGQVGVHAEVLPVGDAARGLAKSAGVRGQAESQNRRDTTDIFGVAGAATTAASAVPPRCRTPNSRASSSVSSSSLSEPLAALSSWLTNRRTRAAGSDGHRGWPAGRRFRRRSSRSRRNSESKSDTASRDTWLSLSPASQPSQRRQRVVDFGGGRRSRPAASAASCGRCAAAAAAATGGATAADIRVAGVNPGAEVAQTVVSASPGGGQSRVFPAHSNTSARNRLRQGASAHNYPRIPINVPNFQPKNRSVSPRCGMNRAIGQLFLLAVAVGFYNRRASGRVLRLLPPSSQLTPRTDACKAAPGCDASKFTATHGQRRGQTCCTSNGHSSG